MSRLIWVLECMEGGEDSWKPAQCVVGTWRLRCLLGTQSNSSSRHLASEGLCLRLGSRCGCRTCCSATFVFTHTCFNCYYVHDLNALSVKGCWSPGTKQKTNWSTVLAPRKTSSQTREGGQRQADTPWKWGLRKRERFASHRKGCGSSTLVACLLCMERFH